MLKAEAPDVRVHPAGDALDRYLRIDLPQIFAWLRTGAKWIVLCAIIGLMLGVAYTLLAKPRYTVTTDILIDPAGLQVVSDDLFRQDGQQQDSALLSLESKRQTLVSRSVLLKVVQTLNLARDPEFVPPTSWTSQFSLRSLLGGEGAKRDPEIVALDSLTRRVSARRDELSFVIILSVWTDNPQKSILISEAIVKIFREELIAADTEGARRSADALNSRIAELKADVFTSEMAVEEFRRAHGLQSSQGELVRTRSMTQINQQLVEARARQIAAQSRYDDLTSSNSSDATAMQSPTISALRTQYATLKSRLDADARIYGPRHPRLAQQQIELQALQSEIQAERRRIIDASRNDLDQANTVVAALEADASSASSEVFTDNDSQVKLRDLMREAAAKTAIYEAFLVRARQITERQQLDTTNMRVISPPVPPQSRSWPPRTAQVGGFGALAGFVIGVLCVLGRGLWREMNGRNSPLPARAGRSETSTGMTGIDEEKPRADQAVTPTPAPTTAEQMMTEQESGSNSMLNLRGNSLLQHAEQPEGPPPKPVVRRYSTGF